MLETGKKNKVQTDKFCAEKANCSNDIVVGRQWSTVSLKKLLKLYFCGSHNLEKKEEPTAIEKLKNEKIKGRKGNSLGC